MSRVLPSGADGISLCLDELLPYRRLANQIQLTPHAASRAHQAGQHQTRSRGRGMDFEEVRQYQLGDDIRAIDWRVTARTGKPHTKLFREERERPVNLVVDLGASMQFGSRLLLKAVQAGHLAALLAWHIAERGDRIGAVIGNGLTLKELSAKGRQPGVLAILHALIDIQAKAPPIDQPPASGAFDELLRRSLKRATPGSQLVIISDCQNWIEETPWLLARLQRNADVSVFMITDPLELTVPKSRLPLALPIVGPASKGLLPIGSGRFRQHYQQQRRQQIITLRQELRSQHIRFCAIGAQAGLDQQLDKVAPC